MEKTMNSTNIREDVALKEKDLTALVEKRQNLLQELNELTAARGVALRGLAEGTKDDQEVAVIGKKLESARVRLEGIDLLITDKEKQIQNTKTLLNDIEGKEASELQRFLDKEEFEAREKICMTIGEREARIFDLWINVCKELWEYYRDMLWVTGFGKNEGKVPGHAGNAELIRKAWNRVVFTLRDKAKAEGWSLSRQPGYPAGWKPEPWMGSILGNTFEIWAALKPETEFLGSFNIKAGQVVDPFDYVYWQRQQWLWQMTKRWRKEKGIE